MSKDESASAVAVQEHSEHHEVVPNPDYDGPKGHCLPPPVKDRVSAAVVFAIFMLALAAGAAWLGAQLL